MHTMSFGMPRYLPLLIDLASAQLSSPYMKNRSILLGDKFNITGKNNSTRELQFSWFLSLSPPRSRVLVATHVAELECKL